MKTIRNIFFLLMIAGFFACREKPHKSKSTTPKVLQGKKADVASLKKRGDNLVDELYEELTENSDELKKLESDIAALNKSQADSLAVFENFNSKSTSYYDAAHKKVDAIRDSLLREKMKTLISKSQAAYRKQADSLHQLDSLAGERRTSLEDWHTILKLALTLPLIEQYQQDHLPPGSPMENIVKKYDVLIRKVDSLASGTDTTVAK